jgi:hypothetical protein
MNLTHLKSISDDVGLFEHCRGREPRYEHGYCVDDVARAIVVLQRMNEGSADIQDLLRRYLAFLDQAQDDMGRVINRRDVQGIWHGEPSTQDHWGRALWAWGTTVRNTRDADLAARAYESFVRSARRRSPHTRSMAFAALGAAEVLQVLPGNSVALALLNDAVAQIPAPQERSWLWPEPRLTYANAVFPEVLMHAGVHLARPHLTRQGVHLLEWLVDVQTTGDHLSPVAHRGWSPGEILPAFDQQPIEVAALVDACTTAYDLTSDPAWSRIVNLGFQWFEGNNDKGVAMFDEDTGAGYDALTEDGRNENCGAESTLAFLSVAERSYAYATAPV